MDSPADRRYWPLPADPGAAAALALPLAQVTSLLQRLGLPGRDAVAEELLAIAGAHVALAQCTIFSYEGRGRPAILGVGDRARTRALPRISQDYVSRFYPLDGSVQLMRSLIETGGALAGAPSGILLHRQGGRDIAHREYRETCYELPQVAERLAVLGRHEGLRWFSINFYRGQEHGPFDDAGIRVIEAIAPLALHAVRLHYTRQRIDGDLSGLLLARLSRRHAGLSKRDLDVVRGLLDGLSTDDLADRLGIEVSSAQTYLKRVYRKTGVSGQRELLGLLLAPAGD